MADGPLLCDAFILYILVSQDRPGECCICLSQSSNIQSFCFMCCFMKKLEIAVAETLGVRCWLSNETWVRPFYPWGQKKMEKIGITIICLSHSSTFKISVSYMMLHGETWDYNLLRVLNNVYAKWAWNSGINISIWATEARGLICNEQDNSIGV